MGGNNRGPGWKRLALVMAMTLVSTLMVACTAHFDAPNQDATSLLQVNPLSPSAAAHFDREWPTTPVRWRIDPACLSPGNLPDPGVSRQSLARLCAQANASRNDPSVNLYADFIAIALSGGGSKASIFAGEAMFMLDRLGLLGQTDMLSAVSGGSYAAALYALSCDRDDERCLAARPGRSPRPAWDYARIMKALEFGNHGLLGQLGQRVLTPGAPFNVSTNGFAEFLERNYLSSQLPSSGPRPQYTFGDLNPRRPHLFLNSTVSTANRFEIEKPGQNCNRAARQPSLDECFLRRRTPEEQLHFAFTDFYFRQLGSRISEFPLSLGIAGASAHPLLIEYLRLKDHRQSQPRQPPFYLLSDGGNVDNQGYMEVAMVMQEIINRQRRSDTNPHFQANNADCVANRKENERTCLEAFGPTDRALIFAINSGLVQATGVSPSGRYRPSLLTTILPPASMLDPALTSIDVYSAIQNSAHEEGYQGQLGRALTQLYRSGVINKEDGLPIRAMEIGLVTLDGYAGGGRAAVNDALALGENPDVDGTDPENRRGLAYRRDTHQRAWARLRTPAAQRALSLLPATATAQAGSGGIHPQCLFEKSKAADSTGGMLGITANQSQCVRAAARWATALRVQELCNDIAQAQKPLNHPGPFDQACRNGALRLLEELPPLHCNMLDEEDDAAERTRITDFMSAVRDQRESRPEDAYMLPAENCSVDNASPSPRALRPLTPAAASPNRTASGARR